MLRNKNIAILYFSRSVQAEVQHKKWLKSASFQDNLSIASFLDEQTQRIIQKSGLPVIQFDEHKQVGETFGHRLANAHQELFDSGFDAVITVGNDCLELNRIHWKNLIIQLNDGKNLIGPNFRKGTYLIGMTKSSFDLESFQQIAWQTENVQDSLIQYFESQGKQQILLGLLHDINSIDDFRALTQISTIRAAIRQSIYRILSILKQEWFAKEVFFASQRVTPFCSLRAPPPLL